ncbi:MAG: hypothetical protein COA93_02550 [Alphaproteobacteria bacterium]|nr:MAG: hypothetical protein COA93_02550 [Alphaproteobacteria bacterium]
MKKIITQLHRFTFRITLSTLIVSFAALPVHAYEGQYSAFNNNNGLRSGINAGFRLRIPFGPTKKYDDKVKYGFQLNLRREFNNNVGWNNYGYMTTSQSFNAEIMSLNFSENGFNGLSLAGQQTLIYKNGVLMAAEGEDKEGGGNGWLIVGGVVLLVAGGAAIATKDMFKADRN